MILDDDGDPVFHCLNDDCMRESCRCVHIRRSQHVIIAVNATCRHTRRGRARHSTATRSRQRKPSVHVSVCSSKIVWTRR
jgi:hypothetical protein